MTRTPSDLPPISAVVFDIGYALIRWQTHHFTTPRNWADHLIGRGLIDEASQ